MTIQILLHNSPSNREHAQLLNTPDKAASSAISFHLCVSAICHLEFILRLCRTRTSLHPTSSFHSFMSRRAYARSRKCKSGSLSPNMHYPCLWHLRQPHEGDKIRPSIVWGDGSLGHCCHPASLAKSGNFSRP